MTTEKIAEGAYFVPSYSEQTIAWSPFGYTIQGVSFEEMTEEAEPLLVEEEQPFSKTDFERDLGKVSQRRMSKKYVEQLRARFPQPTATEDPATYEFETHQD